MDKKKYFAFAGVCGKLSVVGVALVAVLFMSQPSKANDYSGYLNEIKRTNEMLTNQISELIAIEKEQNELLKQVRNKLASIEDNQW